MASREFQSALERLVAPPHVPTAVMCAEALPWKCHRRLIADALVARGVEVVHLLGLGRQETHVLDPNAVAGPDGVVVYPGRR
jgi:uncharacterized protein (DUF488 family)